MIILSNTIQQINAALLGFRSLPNQSMARKTNIINTNNTDTESTPIELPQFEPSGTNKWGWIRYRKFGMCFGSFSQNLTTQEYVPTRVNFPSAIWRLTGTRSYPFSFVKLPTLYFWLKSESNNMTSISYRSPLGPARTEKSYVKIYCPKGNEDGPSGSYSAITYDIIVIGEIAVED